MYYSVKLNWSQPKEGSDEMEKKSKPFLIYAESCTEAEGRMIAWVPSNYQDAVVTDVKKTNIGELRLAGGSETFWFVKVMDDLDGTADKAKAYYVVYDGNHLEEAVRKASSDWSGSELEDIKKFKTIVDEDLISEEIAPRVIKRNESVKYDDSDISDISEEEETEE